MARPIGNTVIAACAVGERLDWFRTRELRSPLVTGRYYDFCVKATSFGLMDYDEATNRYKVRHNWRQLLIERNMVLKKPPEPEPEPDEDKPLLNSEQKRKLAQTTVQSALTHRTALEMAWR